MRYSKPFVDDPENVKDSELQLELLFTEGRMLHKDHLHKGLQDYWYR